MKSIAAIIGILTVSAISLLVLIIVLRLFVQTRIIQSDSMRPSLALSDRVLLEDATSYLRRPIRRGEIIVFYPPPAELEGKDLSWDIWSVLGRATGLPFFPYEPAFVKRVIGLPGERIEIESGNEVLINGFRLEEKDYVDEAPKYSLITLGDMGGAKNEGEFIRPYPEAATLDAPIVVPKDHYFVLGDNRNQSEDSHVFGFLDSGRVIGHVQLKFLPRLQLIEPPRYPELTPELLH